jgi:hypothetical protein
VVGTARIVAAMRNIAEVDALALEEFRHVETGPTGLTLTAVAPRKQWRSKGGARKGCASRSS